MAYLVNLQASLPDVNKYVSSSNFQVGSAKYLDLT